MTYFWDKISMKTKIYYLMQQRLVVESFILQIITHNDDNNATTLWPLTSIYNYLAFFLESKKFLNALLFHSSKQSI